MPAISGNVGAVFNGGMITTDLTLQATSPTLTVSGVGGEAFILVQDSVGDGATLISQSGVEASSDGNLSHAEVHLDQFNGLRITDPLTQDDRARVTLGGYHTTLAHTAPADGDVETGELFLWFDQTNGAAKLMVKAKQADGTVRTGSLALA